MKKRESAKAFYQILTLNKSGCGKHEELPECEAHRHPENNLAACVSQLGRLNNHRGYGLATDNSAGDGVKETETRQNLNECMAFLPANFSSELTLSASSSEVFIISIAGLSVVSSMSRPVSLCSAQTSPY